jgi:hypothetical protein
LSGIIASTCLAVLFVPSFFSVLQGFEEWRKARKKTPIPAARPAERQGLDRPGKPVPPVFSGEDQATPIVWRRIETLRLLVVRLLTPRLLLQRVCSESSS